VRKKLEPDVESWVEEARETAAAAGVDATKLATGVPTRREHDYDEDIYGMDQDEDVSSDPFTDQWADMHDAFQETLQHYVTVQVKKKYTIEEQAMGIENVRTGLRQNLEESDEEEDEEEEEEEEDEAAGAAEHARDAGSGAGGPGAAGGKPTLEPEHLFWLAARGDLDIPRNIPFVSQR
jgi:mediator of RNA polymerase II transcription subunit 8